MHKLQIIKYQRMYCIIAGFKKSVCNSFSIFATNLKFLSSWLIVLAGAKLSVTDFKKSHLGLSSLYSFIRSNVTVSLLKTTKMLELCLKYYYSSFKFYMNDFFFQNSGATNQPNKQMRRVTPLDSTMLVCMFLFLQNFKIILFFCVAVG